MVPRPFLLPQELLEEIFQRLDIESILSLRVVCVLFLSCGNLSIC